MGRSHLVVRRLRLTRHTGEPQHSGVVGANLGRLALSSVAQLKNPRDGGEPNQQSSHDRREEEPNALGEMAVRTQEGDFGVLAVFENEDDQRQEQHEPDDDGCPKSARARVRERRCAGGIAARTLRRWRCAPVVSRVRIRLRGVVRSARCPGVGHAVPGERCRGRRSGHGLRTWVLRAAVSSNLDERSERRSIVAMTTPPFVVMPAEQTSGLLPVRMPIKSPGTSVARAVARAGRKVRRHPPRRGAWNSGALGVNGPPVQGADALQLN
jgi:hypothetical protein